MDSVFWQVLSYITLSLGLLMLIVAAILAVRYKIFSMIFSDFRTKESTEIEMAAESTLSLDLPESSMERAPVSRTVNNDSDGSDNVTMVVSRKKQDKGDMTVVVSRKPAGGKADDFRITRNVLLINADPDVVDR